jgi:hypothetical protein
MYSTTLRIRSLDNTFIRAVKSEEVDEDRKPKSLCGGWKSEFNTIAIYIKTDDATYKKECHKTLKDSPQKNASGKQQGLLHTANAPSLKPC